MKIIATLISMLAIMQAYPQPGAGEILINEILFNPPREGYDYVEGYNASRRIVNLGSLLIANRNASGDIAGGKPVSRDSVYLAPGGYFVVTANEKWLRQHYSVPQNAVICQATLPSFADDEGTVLFINSRDSTVIDELAYSDKWHFSLISDPSGVALERLTFHLPTQNRNNWSSAASSSGYGTPGYTNSRFYDSLQQSNEIIVPALFSPDNDGVDDIELIQFRMKEQGFVASIVIYDLSGRKVKSLLRNESIGARAIYQWDGLDEKSQPLPQGIYIAVTEMFRLDGKTKRCKNVITLARK